ncbi:MAG: hypothetical protein KDK60_01820 [Chlamydiia bacterium]|nr:hypothetical protein [Chlamydiia bacterium]
MSTPLKIYVDRLSDGQTETIDEVLSPDFLDMEERELHFVGKVRLKGKAYLADSHLVIQLRVEAEAIVPCSICNEDVKKTLLIKSFYHTEEVEKIKGHIFDYSRAVREAILLEVPNYVECQGNCPKRKELKQYFQQGEGKRLPFADLN